jgi:hypothetical protein
MNQEREQEVIQKMTSLRAKGYPYHKIAEILDTMQIPTKTRMSRAGDFEKSK